MTQVSADNKQAFGQRLKEICRARGLSSIEAAKKLGVSRTMWSTYQSGKSWPNIGNLVKIAEMLNVTVDYLLTGDNMQLLSDAFGLSADAGARLSVLHASRPDFIEFLDALLQDERLVKLYDMARKAKRGGIDKAEVRWAYDLLLCYLVNEESKAARLQIAHSLYNLLDCRVEPYDPDGVDKY